MRSEYASPRSREAPMDFEYTSRPTVSNVWAVKEDEANSARKRKETFATHGRYPCAHIMLLGTLSEMDSPATSVPLDTQPVFGRVGNIPFLFEIPPQKPDNPQPWTPPATPCIAKAFPQQELCDVDMAEASPPRAEPPQDEKKPIREEEQDRRIATGGMRRVWKSREKAKGRSKLALVKAHVETESEESEEEREGSSKAASKTRNTQHHSNYYTLNLPSASSLATDGPYIMLGYVSVTSNVEWIVTIVPSYLQFFFNLSLILVFLYLLIQFILTVQRDVEHKVAEYSMGTSPIIFIPLATTNIRARYRPGDCAMQPTI